MKKKIKGIDWINHAISFLSALIGIFIAFQLEDYQDSRKEAEQLTITMEAIKKEIENNMSIYRTNVEDLSEWMEYYKISTRSRTAEGTVKVSRREFDMMRSKVPDRFEQWKLISTEKDTMLTFEIGEFLMFDVAPLTGISSSSWQAGLYSGILNKVDHDKLSKLNRIYEWISKDMGLSERDFYMNVTSNISNLDEIVDFYSKVVSVEGLKLRSVQDIYDNIAWN